MAKNHVPVVAKFAQELCGEFGADPDFAVAGAWLHDIGDALVARHAEVHEEVTQRETRRILSGAGYSESEIERDFNQKIAFDVVRERVRARYEAIKLPYSP